MTCSRCGTDLSLEDMTWPGEGGGEVCQNCWEIECDEEWWRALGAPAKPEETKP